MAWIAAPVAALAAEPASATQKGWVVFSAVKPSGVMILTARREGSNRDITLQAGSGMGVFARSAFTDTTPVPALAGPLHDESGLEYDPLFAGWRGDVDAEVLPAGDYTVTSIRLDLGGLAGGWEYKAVAIPFHVTEGRATYLGSYRFLGVRRKGAVFNLFPYRVIVQDQHDRDLPYAKLPARVAFDLTTPDVEGWKRQEFAAKP